MINVEYYMYKHLKVINKGSIVMKFIKMTLFRCNNIFVMETGEQRQQSEGGESKAFV